MTAPSDASDPPPLIDAADLAPHHSVRLPETCTGALAEALVGANRRGSQDALTLVQDSLPDVPHDDRERCTVGPSLGRAGSALNEAISADVVIDAVDGLLSHPDRLRLHRREPSGPERVPTSVVLQPDSAPPTICPERLWAQVAQGATLEIRELDRVIPLLVRLADAIERTTGARVTISGFLSHGPSAGLGRHIDPVEQWIVHLGGTRSWTLWAPSIPYFDHGRSVPGLVPVGEPISFCVEPGSTLVVPRGYFHRVEAPEGLSVHLTLAIDAPSVVELYESWLAGLGYDGAWLQPVHVADAARTNDLSPPTMDDNPDLLREVARFRAGIPPRSLAPADPPTNRYRSVCGGGFHFVEDMPYLDSVVVAAGGRVIRLARHVVNELEQLLDGREFNLPPAGCGAEPLVAQLVGALSSQGLLESVQS